MRLWDNDDVLQIPFLLVTRLWDTYLAEGDKFPDFLVYACASFLLTASFHLLYLFLRKYEVWPLIFVSDVSSVRQLL